MALVVLRLGRIIRVKPRTPAGRKKRGPDGLFSTIQGEKGPSRGRGGGGYAGETFGEEHAKGAALDWALTCFSFPCFGCLFPLYGCFFGMFLVFVSVVFDVP